ncbi:hypothetical protein BDF19DRAFT_247786 [Syncephalis fuscata]|nr:hypothetical protein BDF19DRAFT_247786 [Syncephalis fuscata]
MVFDPERKDIAQIFSDYGPIVRAGSNRIWISDSAMIQKIMARTNILKTPLMTLLNGVAKICLVLEMPKTFEL